MKFSVSKKKKFKSYTNDGNLCHTYVQIAYSDVEDMAILISTYHLCDRKKQHYYKILNFRLIRIGESYAVYRKDLSIKLSSFIKIYHWVIDQL